MQLNAARANKLKSLSLAVAQSSVPVMFQTEVMCLIFGGCCTNLTTGRAEPESGHLITFAQFILVASEGLFYHFDFESPTFLKPNQIPIQKWFVPIILFFTVSVLNNFAFVFNISVPVHTILRSGGSMTTLVIGYIWGKKYSSLQFWSVLLLTFGCVLSALADYNAASETERSLAHFVTGLAVLFVAQVLSAFMGLYIEATYAMYGSNYREGLFYTHALSVPLFIFFSRSIHSQFLHLFDSKPLEPQMFLPSALNSIITRIPQQLLFLILNSFTQYICIRGVNMLGSISSALTVTVVLNIRKLLSLLLSIWLFGNHLSPGVFFGAAIVFGGGFLYAVESQRQYLCMEKARKK
ncbi:UAA transporter [Trichophaea hybrida]|nr:UAA transporter [Trichophaea hybrida]